MISKYFLVLITITSILLLLPAYYYYKNSEVNFYAILKVNDEKIEIEEELDGQRETSRDFIKEYSNLFKCKTDYEIKVDDISNYNYSAPVNESIRQKRMVRGVMLYYPTNLFFNPYEQEFKWLYHSWIEMQKYESVKWRTDLIVSIDEKAANDLRFLKDLNCAFTNVRKSREEKPMCTLLKYKALSERDLGAQVMNFDNIKAEYKHLLKNVDIFSDDPKTLYPFYSRLKLIGKYNYLDSILMAFDGYKYLNKVYDFLIRSDMDVFLTPLFGQWQPRACNDFYVGGGGYSTDFNVGRLARVADNLGIEYAGVRNLGSTWISTPAHFRVVSYLTLIFMSYLGTEEFSKPEIEEQVGTLLWPYWHYGVLLLYGQNLAMNHLIGSNQLNVTCLERLIDYGSGNTDSVFSALHIHVFHGDDLFSKFAFRSGKYDNLTSPIDMKDQVKYYCLYNALESKRKSAIELHNLLKSVIQKKN